MSLPRKITLIEVGPREGFQFEGIGQPDKIATADKVSLVERLAESGLKDIQMVAFVSPKQVPQMADAEAICAAVTSRESPDESSSRTDSMVPSSSGGAGSIGISTAAMR